MHETLLLKLVVTPLLILLATLAGRRWGETVGGFIAGLPLTSGPVTLFLVLDQGGEFARQATAGSLAGVAAQTCFAVGYALTAERRAWPLPFGVGAACFAACAALLQGLALPHLVLVLVAAAALTLGLRLVSPTAIQRQAVRRPVWDLPARVIVATTLVISVTAGAAALGPRLSGLVATFPIFAGVLAVFAHHAAGAGAARAVLRGLMLGLYGFVAFFAVLSQTLGRIDTGAAFALAALGALAVQGLSLRLMRARAAARQGS